MIVCGDVAGQSHLRGRGCTESSAGTWLGRVVCRDEAAQSHLHHGVVRLWCLVQQLHHEQKACVLGGLLERDKGKGAALEHVESQAKNG